MAGIPPCENGCNEDRSACEQECDADGDDSLAKACGGDDCDDNDPRRFPLNTEVCDVEDLDEDCDSSTFGGRDIDRDGYDDEQCCNVRDDGTRNCGTDCDDEESGVHPTEAEMCNRRDDDCDGMIDENACNVPVAVASDSRHACALGSLGTMWCRGENEYGQLGNGSTMDSATAVSVHGLSGVREIDLDDIGYTCARTASGDVYCWGGDETCHIREPTPIFMGMNIIDIDMYYYEMCGVTAEGRTLCTSFDYGCETSASDRCGVSPTDAVEVAVGGGFCCWRLRSGAVECSGTNDFGELGDGTTTSRHTAAPVSGLSDVISIDAGVTSACAVRANGAVVCWGDDRYQQLGRGEGASDMSTVPVPVMLSGTGATHVSVRSMNACAIVSGALECWGRDYEGELVRVFPEGVVHASAGVNEFCAVLEEGVYCWTAFGTPSRINGIP